MMDGELPDIGKLADAETLLRRAVEGREATLGEDHPDTLTSVNNLGSLQISLARFHSIL